MGLLSIFKRPEDNSAVDGATSLPETPTNLWVNSAALVSLLKEVLAYILGYAGIRISKWEDINNDIDSAASSSLPPETAVSLSEFYVSEFKKRNRPVRHDSSGKVGEDTCLVCQEELLEVDGLVYKLGCGHVFHALCMETWLRYCNVSCPLCRANIVLLSDEEEKCKV